MKANDKLSSRDEALGWLNEAMFNLKEEYPYRHEAQRAFGRLMGHLGVKPHKAVLHVEEGYVELVF